MKKQDEEKQVKEKRKILVCVSYSDTISRMEMEKKVFIYETLRKNFHDVKLEILNVLSEYYECRGDIIKFMKSFDYESSQNFFVFSSNTGKRFYVILGIDLDGIL